MSFYVVYYIGHVDCYKRAESYGNICKVYKCEDKAYEFAVKSQIDYFAGNFGISQIGFEYLNKTGISYKEKYNYIIDNFEDFFGEPEFTMQPSCIVYYIEKFKNFGDDSFQKDILKLKKLEDIEITDSEY